jgi:dTDP-4-dehydrorhamnose 3,5-epimerase
MTKTETNVQGVFLLDPVLHGDERGFFMEVWNRKTFAALGITDTFVQDNHSRSIGGTLRGLHYQIRCPQGKLVRVIAGEVFDVAVDLRRSSPTFGQWTGAILSEQNRRMMWIPPGMAHGFYVTSAHAEFVYKCTDLYMPQHERALRWNDPVIAIAWPLRDGQPPLLSAKDGAASMLANAECFD